MKQEKLEEKAVNLFEIQDFRVDKEDNRFTAVKDDQELMFQVFSSEAYSEEEVKDNIAGEASTIFVDEEFSDIVDSINVSTSVLEEDNAQQDYDLPSFELIGDIAVINDLEDRDEETVIEGIREYHPHIETILLKEEQLSGEFRVGGYRTLYGEKTETVHTEFGVNIKVDPTKSYYSERFSTERKRVADQIEPQEKVLVMFAGVGPFALIAAKHSDADRIVAVEKNPDACEYLKENIRSNGFESRVEARCGDVEEILPSLSESFDRVVMPLPGKADQFLKLAADSTAERGTIHYYRFMEEDGRADLEKEIGELLDRDVNIGDIVKCGEKSPSTDRVCVDILLE